MFAASARSKQSTYFLLLCVVSVSLVILSVLPEAGLALPRQLANFLWRLTLGSENTVGAWWSGILLLLAALHAIDGYYRYRAKAVRIAWSWLVIGAVLIALSLDEVGSVHELVAEFTLGEWWSILPFAVVLLTAVAWSFWQLWMDQAHRSASVMMGLGFLCFVSVAGQEYVEHAVTWPDWALPIRLAIEEGTELVGMLILIKVAMRNSGGIFAQTAAADLPALRAGHTLPPQVLLVATVALPLLALFSSLQTHRDRGHPSDWLAASLFLVAALAVWRGALQRATASRPASVCLGLYLIAASLVSVHIPSDSTVQLGTWALGGRLLALSILLVGAAIFVWPPERGSTERRPTYGLLALAGITATFAAQTPDLLATYLLTGVIALFAYCLAAPEIAECALQRLLASTSVAHEYRAASIPPVISHAVQAPDVSAPGKGDLQFQLLEYTHDAVIIWEMDGKGIQYWNPAAERLYGYSREEVHGKVTHSLLRTRAVGAGVSDLETQLARYGMWVGELHHTDCNGRRIEVESRLSLMSQQYGRWLVLEVNRPVSDRAKAAQAQQEVELQLGTLRRQSIFVSG